MCPPARCRWHHPQPGAMMAGRQQERHEGTRSILPAAQPPSALIPKAPDKPALTGTSGTRGHPCPPCWAAGAPGRAGISRSSPAIPRYRRALFAEKPHVCVARIPVDFSGRSPARSNAATASSRCCRQPVREADLHHHRALPRRLRHPLRAAGELGGGFPHHPLLGWSGEAHPRVGSFLQPLSSFS